MIKRNIAIIVFVVLFLTIVTGCSGMQSNLDETDKDETVKDEFIIESDNPPLNPSSIIIKGTEYDTNLESLYLSDMQLTDTDIEPLKYMKNLTYLFLNDNQISDINVLADLPNLQHLILSNNQIKDLGVLKKLTNLYQLDLSDNQISDVSELADLTWLSSLGLRDNQIHDISSLSSLTNLYELWLGHNQISDISILAGLTNLSTIDLEFNQIEDIQMIEKLAFAYNLYLKGNPISETVLLNDRLILYNGPGGEVIIQDGVKTISLEAFYNRQDITGIFIPDSLTSIIDERNLPYVFSPLYGCDNLLNITVSRNHPSYSSRDGVLFSKDGTALVFFPSGRSGSYAIPNGVKYFKADDYGSLSPFSCEKLKSISIPNSVEEMPWAPFARCPELKEINVNSGNRNFSSLDGVLLNKEKTSILAYPPGKSGEYVIPNGVVELEDYAFLNCTGLTSIVLPEGVISLDYSVGDFIHTAFLGCTNLASIVIPRSVTNIDDGVFDDCPNITIHGYVGSIAQQYAEDNKLPFVEIK